MERYDSVIIRHDGNLKEDLRGVPNGEILLSVASKSWKTPGSAMAKRIAAFREVKLIAERIDPHRHAVFVIVDSDPDGLLDGIYEAEQELFRQFPSLPFDLRVMVPNSDWNDRDLRREAFVHYERP